MNDYGITREQEKLLLDLIQCDSNKTHYKGSVHTVHGDDKIMIPQCFGEDEVILNDLEALCDAGLLMLEKSYPDRSYRINNFAYQVAKSLMLEQQEQTDKDGETAVTEQHDPLKNTKKFSWYFEGSTAEFMGLAKHFFEQRGIGFGLHRDFPTLDGPTGRLVSNIDQPGIYERGFFNVQVGSKWIIVNIKAVKQKQPPGCEVILEPDRDDHRPYIEPVWKAFCQELEQKGWVMIESTFAAQGNADQREQVKAVSSLEKPTLSITSAIDAIEAIEFDRLVAIYGKDVAQAIIIKKYTTATEEQDDNEEETAVYPQITVTYEEDEFKGESRQYASFSVGVLPENLKNWCNAYLLSIGQDKVYPSLPNTFGQLSELGQKAYQYTFMGCIVSFVIKVEEPEKLLITPVVVSHMPDEEARQQMFEAIEKHVTKLAEAIKTKFSLGKTAVTDRVGGRPSLDHKELITRLAKAQEAEEVREIDPNKYWKEIATEINWQLGTSKSGVALLRDARSRLERLQEHDPDDLLMQVSEYRAKKTKETK